MTYNQKTHDQFLEELYSKNERYRIGEFIVKSEYVKSRNKILLGTKFGDVKVEPRHLLDGLGFTIESAVDKNEFAKNMIKDVYGECFDLSKLIYTRGRDNVTIGCKLHGFVDIKFNNLLQNRGCPKCGEDIKKELIKNNGGWSYTKWENQAKKSKNFDSYKVYVLQCWNEGESFYKIGKTFNTIEERMKGFERNKTMPYDFEIIKIYVLDNAKDTCKFEQECKNLFSLYRYEPKIKFNGYRECYSKII